MIDESEIADRLRRTFDAVAATTRVGTAPRGRARRRSITFVNSTALLAVAIGAVLVLLFAAGRDSPTRVRTGTPATEPTTVAKGLPSIPGMIVVARESGGAAGYVRESYIHMPFAQYMKTVNARTMWPVTDANGVVVGYIAPDVTFIPLADTRRPGFDIEKVRADRNGGCEDQIGNPDFKQEFPPCRGGK